MSAAQRAIVVAIHLLNAALIAGLLARRRWRSCYTFLLYLIAVLIPGVMISAWPQRFFQQEFWLLKEALHNLLKFAIALELTFHTFRAFPGAQATARRFFLVILVVTYFGVLAVPVGSAEYLTLANQIHPRILNGTIWLFTAIAALILWYRLPVEPLHKAILIGFVPYLLIFTVGLNAVHAFGWEAREYSNYAHTTAYLLLLIYWNHAAWRRVTAPSRAGRPEASDAPVVAAS